MFSLLVAKSRVPPPVVSACPRLLHCLSPVCLLPTSADIVAVKLNLSILAECYVHTSRVSTNLGKCCCDVCKDMENKVVPVYANTASGARCVVALLDRYLSKLPAVAFHFLHET